jgi:predicted GTPase
VIEVVPLTESSPGEGVVVSKTVEQVPSAGGDEEPPDDVKRLILEALDKEAPPTIGVIGVSGVGKSTVINTLFRTTLPTSPTVACTKEFISTDVKLSIREGPGKGSPIALRVVDAPGLGESTHLDHTYLAMYQDRLPECDVVLWVSAARNRAIALEECYLSELEAFQDRMVFGLGQVDLVDPLDWNEEINLPSRSQENNLQEIALDRAARFSRHLDQEVCFHPFSAKRRYNLQPLFTNIIQTARPGRAWLFAGLKGFDVDDWMTEEGRAVVAGRRGDRAKEGRSLGWIRKRRS